MAHTENRRVDADANGYGDRGSHCDNRISFDQTDAMSSATPGILDPRPSPAHVPCRTNCGRRSTPSSATRRCSAWECSPRYDAVIADIGMPRMDGLEMIRHVRGSLPATANCVPAAALTAYARSENRVTALASGFQMHVAKPVNPAELVTAVAALLGR